MRFSSSGQRSGEPRPASSDPPADDAIVRELASILGSPSFVNSPQLSRFLRFVVDQARSGNGGQLKEYLLGVEVFQKDETFDPRIDTVVRTEARRLRHKLAEYYQEDGLDDPVEIALPKGSYCPVFHSRRTAAAPDAPSLPPRRFPTGRRVATAVALFAAAAGLAFWLLARNRAVGAPSIAILPFENLSGDTEQEYFSDGMTDALITGLAKIEGLRVISRTSVLHYKRTKQSVPQIGRELNVKYVLEGTVVRSADRVRVTAQLIAAPDDRHIWAESYERRREDVLALQSELARAIAQQVNARITPQEHARLGSPAVEPEALDAYLQGRFNWHTRDDHRVRQSIDYFRKALSRQPDYALAYAGLADAYSVLAGRADGALRRDLEGQSCAAARRAVELDGRLGEAHASLGGCADTWNWSEREAEFRKAVELSPGNSTAHQWYGALLTEMGRIQEGIAQFRQAVELDPLSPSPKNSLGWALYMARQYPAAIQQYRELVAVFPGYTQAYSNLAIAYTADRKYAEANETLEKGSKVIGPAPPLTALHAHARARAGDPQEARRLIEQWKSRQDITPILMALLYTDVGDKDHAFEWLKRGVEQRSMYIDEVKVEPIFDELHSDPRFRALLRTMNLPN